MTTEKTKYVKRNEAILMHRIVKTLQIKNRSAEDVATRLSLSIDATRRLLNQMNAVGVVAIVSDQDSHRTPIWGIGSGELAPPRRRNVEKKPVVEIFIIDKPVVRLGIWGL
ncbi:MAG: hypothetical protein WAV01_02125 [Candidatus Saccharimonadales bacterium]